jgi:hypothetical protein
VTYFDVGCISSKWIQYFVLKDAVLLEFVGGDVIEEVFRKAILRLFPSLKPWFTSETRSGRRYAVQVSTKIGSFSQSDTESWNLL